MAQPDVAFYSLGGALAKGTLEGYAQSILRIVVGLCFSEHGFQKLFGLLGGHQMHFFSEMWLAGMLECFGGLIIALGLFTRPVAFLLCGEMAVAYFKQHAPRGFWPVNNGGELAVLYCFIYLYFMTSGAGPWSLDRLVRKQA